MPDPLDDLPSRVVTQQRTNTGQRSRIAGLPGGASSDRNRAECAGLRDSGLNEGFFLNLFQSPDAARDRGHHLLYKAHPQSLPGKDRLPRRDHVQCRR